MTNISKIFLIGLAAMTFASCGNNTDRHISINPNPAIEQSTADEKDTPSTEPVTNISDYEGKVRPITADEFRTLIFDYNTNTEWVYNQSLPCIVDFYTDWCKPCKMVAPIMDELADTYKGKINFYKVNIDQQRILAEVFGISSIPSLLFIPTNDGPQMYKGAYQKEQYIEIINNVILK